MNYILTETGCWEWQGTLWSTGYGRVGKRYYAHRLAYEKAFGKLLTGQQVLHRCDNRKCVNPAHLFAGSQADNVKDMVDKGRHAYGERCAHKLTDAIVTQLKVDKRAGVSVRKLAAKYQVACSLVEGIIYGRLWKHVA